MDLIWFPVDVWRNTPREKRVANPGSCCNPDATFNNFLTKDAKGDPSDVLA